MKPELTDGGARSVAPWAVAAVIAVLLTVPGGADPAHTSMLRWVFDGPVQAVARLDTTLYVGGEFTAVAPRANTLPTLIRLDGATGQVRPPLLPRVDGVIHDVEPDGSGGLFLGGSFTTVNGQARPYLAHVLMDGTVSSAFQPQLAGAAWRLARIGPTLFVAGLFQGAGGTPTTGTGAVSVVDGARLAWAPQFGGVGVEAADDRLILTGYEFRGGPTFAFVARAVDPVTATTLWSRELRTFSRMEPFEGGQIVRVGGRAVVSFTGGSLNLAIADGSLDPSWPSSLAPTAMAAVGSVLYLGGFVGDLGGQPREGLGAIDMTTGTVLPWRPAGVVRVAGLAASAGGNLVVLDEPAAGTRDRSRLTQYDATGARTAWQPAIEATFMYGLASDGGDVLIQSPLATFGGVPRQGLAAIDLTTGDLLPWAPANSAEITFLATSPSRIIAGTGSAGFALDPVTGAPLADPGAAYVFADDTWVYETRPTGIHRRRLDTGAEDTGWQAMTIAPTAAAADASTLYFASTRGLEAFDRATGLVRWAQPGTALTVAVVGDTVYAHSATGLVALDRRSGAVIQAGPPSSLIAGALSVADGRLIRYSAHSGFGQTPTLTALTFDGQDTGWRPGAGAMLGSVRSRATLLVANQTLIAGGNLGAREPQPFQGLAFFALDGARAPSALRTRANGPATEFTWDAPAAGSGSGYVLEAGLAPGQTSATIPLGAATSFSTVVPDGRFYVRVRRAGVVGGTDEVSNEILVTGGCAAPPLPPMGFAAALLGANRDRVAFSWTRPEQPLTSYTLIAGSAPGRSDVAIPFAASGSTGFTYASAIPPGTYYVRLRAHNACGSRDTADLPLTIGRGDLPLEPLQLVATRSGSVVTLSWLASPGAVTGYILEAGTDVGLANLATVSLGPATSFVVPPVPAGVYVIRVRAVNAAGVSRPSSDLILRLP